MRLLPFYTITFIVTYICTKNMINVTIVAHFPGAELCVKLYKEVHFYFLPDLYKTDHNPHTVSRNKTQSKIKTRTEKMYIGV